MANSADPDQLVLSTGNKHAQKSVSRKTDRLDMTLTVLTVSKSTQLKEKKKKKKKIIPMDQYKASV